MPARSFAASHRPVVRRAAAPRATGAALIALVGALPLVLAARPAAAQRARPLFGWAGPVDREVRLVLRGRDLAPRFLGNNEQPGRDRARITAPLPSRDGRVVVAVERGRGQVDVIQQPSAANDWTAVVRVRDDAPGADRYRVQARWEGNDDGRWGSGRWGNGGWSDGRRDDDDRWGDRDDDDRRRRAGGWDGDDRGGWDRGGWDRDGAAGDGRARGLLRWRGRVDDGVEVRVRGGQVSVVTLSGSAPTDVRWDVEGRPLPARDVGVSLGRAEGRGRVTVVQQPSVRNGWTAVVRIADPQSGAGVYDLDLRW